MSRIAVVGMGAMGSAIAKALPSSSAEIVTYLEGRSSTTRERVAAASIREVELTALVDADVILSVLPPSQALAVADLVAPAMRSFKSSSAVFVDCNAISTETMGKVAQVLHNADAKVLDGCIIGGPSEVAKPGPRFYLSGGARDTIPVLVEYGLDARALDRDVGAASALEMCYAAINKGLIGLGASMLLAAARSGAKQALMAVLSENQSRLVAKLAKDIPDMYPKEYRWVEDMDEIAAFLGADDPAADIFSGMAAVFQRLANDRKGNGEIATTLSEMLADRPEGSLNRYDALSNRNFDEGSKCLEPVPSARESQDRAELEEGLEASFPAGDPISATVTSEAGSTRT